MIYIIRTPCLPFCDLAAYRKKAKFCFTDSDQSYVGLEANPSEALFRKQIAKLKI